MQRELEKIEKNFRTRVKKITNIQELKIVEKNFLGKKGALRQILGSLKTLDKREKKKIGKLTNQLKKDIKLELKEVRKKIAGNNLTEEVNIDITLPGKKLPQGHIHPLTQTLVSVERVFESMGFSVFLSPEVENEFYNFDALNIPANHPARDLWDTFWLKDNQKTEKLLLRTHTTAMQLRYMKNHNPPFRIITPGKCYRYEASDSTHDIQFYQVDGLVVNKEVSISNFKAIIEELFKKIFSTSIKTRIRPGYFPFVEPGFEIDIACYKCQGKNCPICKGTGWLEVMGAGMVHPEVFKNAGYNPLHWQGFAFGMGLDRLAMIKYGISDVRLFYQNDLRFLKQF
jgi:phenylalanyl-tRNA synthetase alpha chain